MKRKVNQPGIRTTRKVAYGTGVGVAATILIKILEAYFGLSLTPEEAAAIITGLIFIVQYFMRNTEIR